MLFNRQPSVGLPPNSTSIPPASSQPSRRRAGSRSSATISIIARAATVGLLIATYLTVFCYLEGNDLSFETVTAANQQGEAEWEALRQERNATRIRRAQEREERREQQHQRKNTKKNRNNPEEDDDTNAEEPEGFSLWRFLMFYTLLRILMRSRMEDQSLLQSNNTRTTTRSARRAQRLAALDRQQRFRAWADRLNEQRVASGQRPLSLESLQLVLRERELHDGQDYDGLLQFHEESGPAMEALINGGAGMTEAEIDRLPLRVVQAEDDLLLSNNNNNNQNDTYFCSVCLEAFQEGDSVRTVPCFHTFHQQCIDDWLSQKGVCPICKHAALG